MAKINLGDLNVTNARKIAKEAGLKGLSKADLPTIVTKLEELDEAALLDAYAKIVDVSASDEDTAPQADTETQASFEPSLIAVFPGCPACNTQDVPAPSDDGVTVCACEQELLIGTHETCGAELSCIGTPDEDAICPSCGQPLYAEADDDNGEGITLKLNGDTIIYSDPTTGIAGRVSLEVAREKAKLGKGKDFLDPDEFGMELSCQNPTCSYQKGEYNVPAQFLLDQLERAMAGASFRPITPWHPGHPKCREAMLASDVPCPLGCGHMLEQRGAEISQTGKLAICSSCRGAIEGQKVTTTSSKSGEEVTLPAWSYLAENFYGNQILTHEELAEAKSGGYEPNYEGPGTLSVEVIETINNLITKCRESSSNDHEDDDDSPSSVKCPRCSKDKLTIAQAHKLADYKRVVCASCAKELSGPKEPVECAFNSCTNTVFLTPLQRYLIGDENVRCAKHQDEPADKSTDEPEKPSELETEPVPEIMPNVHASAPVEFEDEPVQTPVASAPITESPAATSLPAATATSDMAQVIIAMAQVLQAMPQQQNMAQIMQAIPAQPDLAAILSAVIQPQPDLAALITSSKESSGTEEALVEQLGMILEKLLEDRTATVSAVDDIPRRVRSEIFGDLNGDHVPGTIPVRQGSRPLSVEEPTLDD